VNLILFEANELERPLPRGDRRAVHLLTTLHRQVGESFDAGVINGPRGKGVITRIGPDDLAFTFGDAVPTSAPPPLVLVVGLPRPQTARDILRDATTLGATALHFVRTERAEPGYAQSSLWTSGEWRRHLVAGAEQAFDTHLPEVTWNQRLVEVVAQPTAGARLVLDHYESLLPLSRGAIAPGQPVVLAIGCERGWTAAERELLRAHGFQFHHLGPRVLRTETACTVALAIVRTKLGLM